LGTLAARWRLRFESSKQIENKKNLLKQSTTETTRCRKLTVAGFCFLSFGHEAAKEVTGEEKTGQTDKKKHEHQRGKDLLAFRN
jgi:hypothetical protein